jgi:hydroxypyruvate isomerase
MGCKQSEIDAAAPYFQAARARREHCMAKLAEHEFRQKQSELVERTRVERAAQQVDRLLRNKILGLPVQLAPELAPMQDARRQKSA